MTLLPISTDLKTCAWCAGTKERPDSGSYAVSCLVCGGKGEVRVTEPAEPCLECQGRGRRNETAVCLTCAGTGWARVFVKKWPPREREK